MLSERSTPKRRAAASKVYRGGSNAVVGIGSGSGESLGGLEGGDAAAADGGGPLGRLHPPKAAGGDRSDRPTVAALQQLPLRLCRRLREARSARKIINCSERPAAIAIVIVVIVRGSARGLPTDGGREAAAAALPKARAVAAPLEGAG